MRRSQPAAAAGKSLTTPAITSVGIPTRDRTTSLIACLTSYLENCQQHGRTPDLIVADDSASAETRAGTRTALQRLERNFSARIRYAGLPEKSRFADALAGESGLPLAIIRFALLGDERYAVSTGANRNCLLLDTLGALMLSVDDDTRCRMAATPGREDAVAFHRGYDPTEFWFFPDRTRALESVSPVEVDVLGCHEALLGHATADLGGPADATGRVAVTLHGLLGDSGMSSPRHYLTLTGASRDRLLASSEAYRSAFRSREVLRAVRRPTVSAGSFCMTTFIGFDNRVLLPPFLPVQRNADGVFGLLVQKCTSEGRLAFLPWVLLHSPDGLRTFTPDEMATDGASVRMADIVIACVSGHEMGDRRFADATRFRRLGKHLQSLGALDLTEFEAHVRGLLRHRANAFVAILHGHLHTYRGSPQFWSEDVTQLIAVMMKATMREDYVVPRDLRQYDNDDARQLSQRLVARFGELLEAWPTIVAAARRLRASGQRLTQPIAG